MINTMFIIGMIGKSTELEQLVNDMVRLSKNIILLDKLLKQLEEKPMESSKCYLIMGL